MGFLDKLLGRTKEEAADVTRRGEGRRPRTWARRPKTWASPAPTAPKDMGEDAKTEVEEHMPGRDTP